MTDAEIPVVSTHFQLLYLYTNDNDSTYSPNGLKVECVLRDTSASFKVYYYATTQIIPLTKFIRIYFWLPIPTKLVFAMCVLHPLS